jgi:hypothetical protein
MKSTLKNYIQKKYGIDLLQWKPQIKGSPIKAKHINKILNFDLNEVIRGIEVEHEHTSDPIIAMEIAFAHLLELKDYYVRLDKMEEEGKKELGIKEDINQNSKESKMKRQDVLTAYNYLMRQKEVLSEETFELKYGERLEKIEAIMESEDDDISEGKRLSEAEIRHKIKELQGHISTLKYRYASAKRGVGNYAFMGRNELDRKIASKRKEIEKYMERLKSIKEDIDTDDMVGEGKHGKRPKGGSSGEYDEGDKKIKNKFGKYFDEMSSQQQAIANRWDELESQKMKISKMQDQLIQQYKKG